ncbi:tRNA (guanosine(46)-N7)-methyltransferase TrmB [Vulcanibacillus modesticaldus]|uniref:tRNA (guanine-N(7)-)-methyltransferase n=1 Tax=Vulcanibacillus modesticaldus TaxID=337097 RepID=A0A1D2YU69_9BACI|nr:tRNA (guanosine(46)-N7)-methyltransferase TrmB [Vulcanibacillus modesticaldus]OEF99201.1 tRNA (guanosine(46)-N7)-methyltransferase TrmB [Vulcanibacillus modesticaldus]
MRLRKRPWVKEEIMQYTSYTVVNPENHKGVWHKLFQNNNPIYVELGTGRGRFITSHAQNNPEINYIAIEQKQEVLVQAIRKANHLELSNIKFILGNVNRILDFFGQGEISRIYLNFIDPWPKKRHAKRRLTHQRFLDMYKHILNDNGEIHFKTDNELLFEFSLNELSGQKFRLSNISLNLYRDEHNLAQHIQTEYEEKFINQGKPIYRLEAKKES